MAALFPDAYMHIGGDEMKASSGTQSADQAFMKEKALRTITPCRLTLINAS